MENEFICEFCGKKFKSQKALSGHLAHCKAKKKEVKKEIKEEVKKKVEIRKKETNIEELASDILKLAEEKYRLKEKKWKEELKKFRETILKLKEMGYDEFLKLPITKDGIVYIPLAPTTYEVKEDGTLIKRAVGKAKGGGIQRIEREATIEEYAKAYKKALSYLQEIKRILSSI